MCSFLNFLSICQAADAILMCLVLLSFFCRSSAVFLVILLVRVFCRVVLSCFLQSSLDVFIWHSVVVIYNRVLLKTFFDMGEEGHA